MLLVLAGAGDSLVMSGLTMFATKIIEEKFNVESSLSGKLMGR
jgi:hypothetical protein